MARYAEDPPAQSMPASTPDLGAVRSEHPLLRPLWPLIVGAMVLAAGTSALVVAGGGVVRGTILILPWFGLLAGLIVYRRWPPPGGRVVLHEAGLVIERPGEIDSMSFWDVDEVWYDFGGLEADVAEPRRLRAVRLRDVDGRVLVVPGSIHRADVVFDEIITRCSMPVLRMAREALADGETLRFGPARLDRHGLHVHGARVSWTELGRVRLGPGTVSFARDSRRPSLQAVRLDEMPHPFVFVKLVETLAQDVSHDPTGFGVG